MSKLNVFLAYLFLLGFFVSDYLGQIARLFIPPLRDVKDVVLRVHLSELPAYVLVAVIVTVASRVDGLSPTIPVPDREKQFRLGHVLIAFATIVHVLFSYIVPLASAFMSPWFIGLGRLPLPFGLLKPIAWVVGLYLISRSGSNPTGVRGHTWQIDAANVNCFVAYLFLLVHLLGNPLGYYAGLLLPRPPGGDPLLRGYLLLLPACFLASLMLLVVWKVDGLSPSSRIPEREAQYRNGHVMLLFATVLYAVAAFAIPLAAKFISPWLGFGLWFTGHIYFLALIGWLIGSYLVLRAGTRVPAPSANAGAA